MLQAVLKSTVHNVSWVLHLSVQGIKTQLWLQQVGWSGVPARESDEETASSTSRQEEGRQQACQAQPELDGAAASSLQKRRAGQAGEMARGASLCRHVQVTSLLDPMHCQPCSMP